VQTLKYLKIALRWTSKWIKLVCSCSFQIGQHFITLSEGYKTAHLIFLLIKQSGFPRMVRPIGYIPIHLPMEEVAMHAGHKVLMEVDDNSALIVVDSRGILDKQIRSTRIRLINLFNLLMVIFYIINAINDQTVQR